MSFSTNKPSVVFVSASVGAGHVQAARALLAGLAEADPQIDAQVVNALDFVDPHFRAYYEGGFELGVSHVPRLYGLSYRLLDRPTGPRRTLGERVRLGMERSALRRLLAWLERRQPVLAVGTHYLAMPAIARLIDRGARRIHTRMVVTDNEIHRWWYSERIGRYFVPNEDCRDKLHRYGIDPGRITISGIPVHPKWHMPLDEQAIRAAWRLPADRPTVLISGGVEYTVGRIGWLAQQIAERVGDVSVVVLTGANKALYADVQALPAARGPRPRVRAQSFTDRIHELVSVSDVVVTKPGGLITTECLTKGAAMVLMKPVPGQEAANARLLSAAGAARVAQTGQEVLEHLTDLLKKPAELRRLRENAARLARHGTSIIVKDILETVKGWT
jgi:processive 1,2-diacylglycerol beta-glucosyltransferase